MPKILILTAGYGEGHNSAARALQTAFNELPNVEVELIDIFALRAPWLNFVSRRAYVRLINTAPRVWSWVYRWLDRSPRAPLLLRTLASHRRLLGRIIADREPAAVVSTYPVYGWLLNQLRREGHLSCPHFTVVTDALTINSLWYRAAADGWFVTDHDSAEYLRSKGLPASRVHVSGFPVSLEFADRPLQWQPPDPVVAPACKVLYMINSGRRSALRIARALLEQRHWHITFTAGRDAALIAELKVLARDAAAKAEILGWTNRIPELLMTHHVVISKAGGATTQEAINALCPMLISQVVPGQEEGNCELLRRHEAGALAESPPAIVTKLRHVFASDATLWRQWRTNLKKIARPGAARDIARHVIDHINTPALSDRGRKSQPPPRPAAPSPATPEPATTPTPALSSPLLPAA